MAELEIKIPHDFIQDWVNHQFEKRGLNVRPAATVHELKSVSVMVNGTIGQPRTLRFQRLPHGIDLPLPAPAKPGDAGLDLAAARDLVVPAGAMQAVPTGFAMAIPPGHFGMVVPRSGLVRKNGITVANSPGIVDAGYRGEVVVLLLNRGQSDFEVRCGDRIAQMIVMPFSDFERAEVVDLDETERGTEGFGSSGR